MQWPRQRRAPIFHDGMRSLNPDIKGALRCPICRATIDMSLTTSRTGRGLANAFGRATSLWLSQVDRWLVDRPSALDVASGSYFLGRRGERALSALEVVQSYRGLVMR